MPSIRRPHPHQEWLTEFQIQCDNCSGLCCYALFLNKSESFRIEKPAGVPCVHLLQNYHCGIHSDLIHQGMKGCVCYDCLGAGQKVTAHTYQGSTWKSNSSLKKEICVVFSLMYQLHQMMWYLLEASSLICAAAYNHEINHLLTKLKNISELPPKQLRVLSLDPLRSEVNIVLKKILHELSSYQSSSIKQKHTSHYMGINFRHQNLNGYDFSMCTMIASDLRNCQLIGVSFLGADVRDVDIRGTDISQCVFLTQGQLNAMKGDSNTIIPSHMVFPPLWNQTK